MNKSSPQSCLPLLKCLERDLYLQVKSVQNMQQLAQLQINDAHKTGADHTWSRICVTSSAGKLDLELSLFGGIKSGTGRIVITDMIWKHRTGTLMRPNPTKRGLLLCFLPGGILGGGGLLLKPTFSGRASSSSSSHKVHCFPTWWRVRRFPLLLLRKCIQMCPDSPDATTRNPSRIHNFDQETLNNFWKLWWPRREQRDDETKLQERRTPQPPPGFRPFICSRQPITGAVTSPRLCWSL